MWIYGYSYTSMLDSFIHGREGWKAEEEDDERRKGDVMRAILSELNVERTKTRTDDG